MRIAIYTFSVMLSLALQTQGQTSTKITGQVLDQSTLSPVSGATVQIMGTGYTAVTDNRGYFQFDYLPAGEYKLRVSSLSYAAKETPSLTISQDAQINLVLELTPHPIPLPPLVVKAPNKMWQQNELSSDNIILDNQELQKSPGSNLSDILGSLPGVQIFKAGPTGSSRISIRGSSTDQVLVLLNGARINSAQTGETDIDAIPLSQVERIEVVKGAQTARYGPDALAGVINIITKSVTLGDKDQFDIKLSSGSFGTQSWEAGANKSLTDNFGVSLWGTNFSTEGDFTYRDSGQIQTRQNSGQVKENLCFNFNWQNSPKFNTGLTYFKYFARHQLPGPLLQTNDSAYAKDFRENLTLNSALNFNPKLSWESRLGYQNWRQTFYIQEPYLIPADSENKNRQWEIDSRLNSHFSHSKLSWGISSLWSELVGSDHQRPALSLGKVSRSTYSTFISAEQKLPDYVVDLISLSAAFRYDRTEGMKSEWSPQLGLILSQGEKVNLRIKGNWGKSYHNPTLNALFWKEDAYASGNPNLRPERAASFDAGTEVRLPILGEVLLGHTYFKSQVKDLITWQRAFDGKYTPVNVSQAKLEGFEQIISWRTLKGALQLEFNHTLSDAINQTEIHTKFGNLIPFRPRHLYNFKLFFQSEKLDLNLESRYSSRRFTREQNTSQKILPAFTIWGLSLKFKQKLGPVQSSTAVGILNFLDQDYELIERYPMPGREFRISTQFQI